jgi:tRNA(fMet)-specific endonuclease VapC
MAVVVDTCVVSFVFKRDSRAELYRPHLDGNLLVISFMTLAELYRWPLERDWGETRRMALEQRMREYTVYPFTRDLCRQWATATDEARRNGNEIKVDDAWIAATALLYDIPLVTHNRSDFEGVPDLSVISES